MSYITITGNFIQSGDNAKLLLSTARLFSIASNKLFDIVKEENPPTSKIWWYSNYSKTLYRFIPYARYIDGVIENVFSIYKRALQDNIDLKKVVLEDWLFFQSGWLEYPGRGITLLNSSSAKATVFDYKLNKERIEINFNSGKLYKYLMTKILMEKQKYMGKVSINSWNVRNNTLFVSGKVEFTIPYEFYLRHAKKVKENNGKNLGGIDINTDRINLVIINKNGRLLDKKTFWFSQTTARNFPKIKARTIISQQIHNCLKYAYYHGVKTLFIEDPWVLSLYRKKWINGNQRYSKNYNYKVSTFRSKYITQQILLKAPLYDITVKPINPRGTSSSNTNKLYREKYGIDRHTASAYLIALRGINLF